MKRILKKKRILKIFSYLSILVFLLILFLFNLYKDNTRNALAFSYVNNMSADWVIGQDFFNNNDTDDIHASAQSLYLPRGMVTDGTHLFIGDCNNNRVLIYNSIPASTNAPADVVIGQPDMHSDQVNQGNLNFNPGANTLSCPQFLATDGTKLFVADSGNNRVLIYNTIPTSNDVSADVVIGQQFMASRSANQGGSAGANTLNQPTGVFFDSSSGKFFIADRGNNRVLIYNSVPSSNNASANVVVGQANMSGSSVNQGGVAASNTLRSPTNARVIGTKLFVTDLSNNRVLIYNSIPASNNTAADVVVGQANMSGSSVNQGGSVTANTLKNPTDIKSNGSDFLISDGGNNRILIFNSIPTSNNTSADGVIGQANLTSNTASTSASFLNSPGQMDVLSGDLYVADTLNHRALIFTGYSNLSSATYVLGQTDFVSKYINETIIPNNKGIVLTLGVATDGTHLFVSDCGNNRVLVWNTIPTSSGTPADVVIGQQNFSSNSVNQGGSAAANTLSCPKYLSTDGTHLVVSDTDNNRVLIFNSIPTSNNASADVVIGQANMTGSSVNQGGAVGGNTLNDPDGVDLDSVSGKLVVTDSFNNRVLIFDTLPSSNNASASAVVGQPDMISNGDNRGGGPDANTLSSPWNSRIIQNQLLISDAENNRVLIFNSIPTTNDVSADVVIGQPDMTSNSENQGLTTGANTLDCPFDILWDGANLLLADSENNRVLIFNSIPTTNDASADVVIGQPDMTSSSPNQGGGPKANTFLDSGGQMAFANDTLFLGDKGNNRVLVFAETPAPTDTPTPTPTPTPTSTPSPTPTGTLTPTPTPSPTPTGTLTPTPTGTLTPTPTGTFTLLPTGPLDVVKFGVVGVILTILGAVLLLVI